MNLELDARAKGRDNKRLVWLDTAKGIGIVLVVYAHQLRAQVSAGQVDGDWKPSLQDSIIYAFHMPMFFLISGLTVAQVFHRLDRVEFVRTRFVTLIYPYLLWSFISLGLAIVGHRYVNHTIGVDSLLSIFWKPVFQFWFLYALFICHMIAFVVGMRNIFIAIIAVAALVSPLDLRYPILVEANASFPFFAVGVLLSSKLTGGIKGLTTGALLAGALMSTIAFVVLFLWRDAVGFDISILNFLLACCGIITVFAISAMVGERSHLLAQLGATSMAIFILHTIVATGIRSGLRLLDLPNANTLQLAICVIGGIVIPIVIQRQVSKAGFERPLGLIGPKQRETT